MRDKAKYLITGFVIGAITVWFFTFIALSSKSTTLPNYQMDRGMMGSFQNSEVIDKHFIEEMIPHHEDAITMSELALEKSTRPEIRDLAENIITTQSQEIDQMRKWYEDWFGSVYGDEDYDELEMGYGMMAGRMGMMGDFDNIKDLENAEDFDTAFLRKMIPHHQMALMMASMLLRNTERDEMKELGKNIIETQSSEIELMKKWLQEWE